MFIYTFVFHKLIRLFDQATSITHITKLHIILSPQLNRTTNIVTKGSTKQSKNYSATNKLALQNSG